VNINEENAGVAGTATPAAGDSAQPATSAKPAKAVAKPAAAKPAATKAKEAKPAQAVKPATKTPEQGGSGKDVQTENTPGAPEKPLAKSKLSPAAEIAKKHNVSEVHENEAGEFFLNHNLAMLSVNQDATKLKKHTF
jgi:hypothetical protein